MSMVADGRTTRTGFPFNFTEDDYVAEQRLRETRDLLAEINAAKRWLEHDQYLALEYAGADDGTYDYITRQLPAMLAEIERKQRILVAYCDHPLRPRWPKLDDRFHDRIDAVRAAWPIERFCRELLACELVPAGRGTFKAQCPLSGHSDKTPSFSIDTVKDVAYCHGCKRGGDVLKLTQYALNLERFTDALKALEREGGVQ
jgi:hypothetical protein